MNKGRNIISFIVILLTIAGMFGATLLLRNVGIWGMLIGGLTVSFLGGIIGGLPVLTGGLITLDKSFVFNATYNLAILISLGFLIYSWFFGDYSLWEILAYDFLLLAVYGSIYRTINSMKKELAGWR